MKKNKGYTLVEMLIVLAIMAILSGLAVVSVGLIRKAKIQDAITSFDSQLTNLWMLTKSTSSGRMTMNGEFRRTQKDGRYVYEFVINDGTTEVSKTVYSTWNRYVDVAYEGNNVDTPVELQFDKSTGGVVSGSGDYTFYIDKNSNNKYDSSSGKDGSGSSDEVVAVVHLDGITGNHYIK